MAILRIISATLALGLLSSGIAPANEGQWRGNVSGEYRYFSNPGIPPAEYRSNFSLSAEVEYYRELAAENQSLTVTPFARLDQHDNERSHFDFRELRWTKFGEQWVLNVGFHKVFWGVAESRHLVDIINQTDLVENVDGEDKLGQPMINLSLIRDWGTIDLFVMSWFRERTFPGPEGRPALLPFVDTNNPVYQSEDADEHIDFAARWSHTLGLLDVGISYFDGTGRDPRLLPATVDGVTVLRPHYDLIQQTGIDAQITTEAWLWKLEAIHQQNDIQSFNAAVGGFEYTFVGVFDSAADVGMITEYLYDDRGDRADHPFQDDVLVGFRLTLNDEQSSEALLGVIRDLNGGATTARLEASRRIGSQYTLSIEATVIESAENDPFYQNLTNDEFIMLEFAYHF